MEKVSVIIPTFNRFSYLLNAVKSVLNQTYKNIEVIIVNDNSTQKEYYTYDFKNLGNNVFIIHLPRNSRSYLGHVCGGGQSRNIGIMQSAGQYIAFLDDDDYFLPTKIEKQINQMKKHNVFISCTEAFGGKGPFNPNSQYRRWHYKGIHWKGLKKIFKNNPQLLNHMYKNPINIWTKEHLNIHNCTCGGSSIVIKRDLIDQAGYFPLLSYAEDWEYWKRLITHSNCVFLREPLTYIDLQHGDGRNYT